MRRSACGERKVLPLAPPKQVATFYRARFISHQQTRTMPTRLLQVCSVRRVSLPSYARDILPFRTGGQLVAAPLCVTTGVDTAFDSACRSRQVSGGEGVKGQAAVHERRRRQNVREAWRASWQQSRRRVW